MSDKIPHTIIVDCYILAYKQMPEGEYMPVATDKETVNVSIECSSENECKNKIEELKKKISEVLSG